MWKTIAFVFTLYVLLLTAAAFLVIVMYKGIARAQTYGYPGVQQYQSQGQDTVMEYAATIAALRNMQAEQAYEDSLRTRPEPQEGFRWQPQPYVAPVIPGPPTGFSLPRAVGAPR